MGKTVRLWAILLIAVIVGALSGAVTSVFLSATTPEERIAEFYATETAVMVSPHGLRKAMDKGDDSFILVDLRSEEEYLEEHIVGAISIPAYKSRDESAYGEVERIVSSFKALPDKDIIVYCYSMPCMTGRKIGTMLAENGVYVKELGVGWNEWRYFWTLWNHPHEWNTTSAEMYVASGPEPGVPELRDTTTPCSESNQFGC